MNYKLRIANYIFYILPVICLLLNSLFASDIEVFSKVDKSEITIGDLIAYSVLVKHNENIKIDFPSASAKLGDFEIRDYIPAIPKKKGNIITQEVKYIITTYEVGEYNIPPINIKYWDNNKEYNISSQNIKIKVKSVKASDAKDIRDIKKPVEIKKEFKSLLILFASLIVVSIIVILIIKLKNRKRVSEEKTIEYKSAWEIAVERLSLLKEKQYQTNEEIKEYYIELSDIIREYIEKRYEIKALEMTTPELVRDLKQIDNGEITKLVEDLLTESDLVKFAKFIPANENIEGAINTAFEIIEKTKIIKRDEAKVI